MTQIAGLGFARRKLRDQPQCRTIRHWIRGNVFDGAAADLAKSLISDNMAEDGSQPQWASNAASSVAHLSVLFPGRGLHPLP